MEVQGFADRHEEKEFYAALKEVYGPIHSTTVPLSVVKKQPMDQH